jgi:hypothetical protein
LCGYPLVMRLSHPRYTPHLASLSILGNVSVLWMGRIYPLTFPRLVALRIAIGRTSSRKTSWQPATLISSSSMFSWDGKEALWTAASLNMRRRMAFLFPRVPSIGSHLLQSHAPTAPSLLQLLYRNAVLLLNIPPSIPPSSGQYSNPSGRYYLGDGGYANSTSLLVPYRSTHYHLKEWGQGKQRYVCIVVHR